jgi:hypothetical protein
LFFTLDLATPLELATPLDLATPLEKNTIIAFRTKAILWMCSQLVAESRSNELKENAKSDFSKITTLGRRA